MEQYVANALQAIYHAYTALGGAEGEPLAPEEEQAIANVRGMLHRAQAELQRLLQARTAELAA